MCTAATFRRAPQEEHYYANLFVFPTKHEVVALEKSPRSAHLCFTPPRLIITPFHQRLCEATPSDREQREREGGRITVEGDRMITVLPKSAAN